MARDGSGNYNLPAGNPVSTGGTISSTWANNTMTDIASALTQSVSKDGQTAMTGNQPMGGNKHVNVGNASARNEYAALGQVQDGAGTYLISVSGTNTITAAVTGLAAYAAGQVFRFVAAGGNTGAVTLNINALGAKAITKQGTTALVSGDIVSGSTVVVVYDGTQFQIVNQVATVASQTAATLTATSAVVTDTISERTAAAGVTIDGVLCKDNDIEVDECRSDTVSEKTSGAGVTVDGVLLKDGIVAASARPLTGGTLATASGQTELTWTSTPSWVRKITIVLNSLSTSGSVIPLVQLGTSSGYVVTGYTAACVAVPAASRTDTTGFVFANAWASTYTVNGHIVLTKTDSTNNVWVCSGLHTLNDGAALFTMTGVIALAATLDRVRLRMDGSNTFDAGSANILYE